MHRVAALEKIQVIHAKKNKFVLLESMQSELDWLCICKCAYPCDIYLIELCRVKKTELLFRMVFKQCVNWSPALKNAGSYVRWLCTIFGFLPYGNCMLIHWSYAVGLLLWRQKMWVKLFLQSSFSLFQAAWRSMRLQPLSVFLVKNGQGGDRILFRYPYKVSTPKKATTFYGNASGTSGGGGGSGGVGDAILTGW